VREYDLRRLLDDPALVEEMIRRSVAEKQLFVHRAVPSEIAGHMQKADHNLRFVEAIADKEFLDWVITGCYYACYHAALALNLTKGYVSKNHYATLCVLIKEFYGRGIVRDDLEMVARLLDYQDLLFYVEAKHKREDASYATKTRFDKAEVRQLRIKAALFVSKVKVMIAG
jgi:uncharacterized protein (UPF0332 family)